MKRKREPLTIDAYIKLYGEAIQIAKSFGFYVGAYCGRMEDDIIKNDFIKLNRSTPIHRNLRLKRCFIEPFGKCTKDDIPECFTIEIMISLCSDLRTLDVEIDLDGEGDDFIIPFDMFETLKADGKPFPAKELSDLIARKIKSADEFLKETATNKISKEEYLAYLNVVRKIRFMYASKVGFGKNDIFSLDWDDESEYGIKCNVASRTWGWDDNPDGAWSIFDEKQIRVKPELDIDWNG